MLPFVEIVSRKERVLLNDYVYVKKVYDVDVQTYLNGGWEIIEKTKNLIDMPNITRLEYHIGMSAKVLLQQYDAIIRDYEKYGLKDSLFEKIAESNEHSIKDYVEYEGYDMWRLGDRNFDATSKYITNYEKVINNSTKTFVKNKDTTNFVDDTEEVDF